MVEMAKPGATGRPAYVASANVLLDAVVGWDAADEALSHRAMNLALVRLNETDAISVEVNADDDLAVKIDNLVCAALVPLHWLVTALARERSVDREVIISDLRGFLAAVK